MSALMGVFAVMIISQPPKPLDMDRLAYAVSVAESSACKRMPLTASGTLTNNCHGIMRKGKYAEYADTAESYAAFKYTWARSYKRFPDRALAAKYSSEGAADRWLCHVRRIYYSFPFICV